MGPIKCLEPQWENFPLFNLVFWVFGLWRLGVLLCADTLPSLPFLSASWPILTPADVMISNAFLVKTFFGNRIWRLLLAAGDTHVNNTGVSVWEKVQQSQGENGPAITQTQKLLEYTAGWTSLQTASLPGKLQCRGEEKGNGFYVHLCFPCCT